MSDYVIITAGGKGLRMGGDIPKQFLSVGGLPVLMRTIRRFREYSGKLQIILVLPHDQRDYWQQLCEAFDFREEYLLADGGDTRFASIRNGLRLIPENAQGIVAVHDGVRPFVSVDVIARCFETARSARAVIPVTPVVETLRSVSGHCNVLRSDYRLVQTPQCFDIPLLKRAYAQPDSPRFTDDASVVEALGETVTMVDGNRENIKLTTPFDLKIAEAILS